MANDDDTAQARQAAEDLGIEDVDGFLAACADQAEKSELKLDPTPWLPKRMALRMTNDEWRLFQGAPQKGVELESFLRAITTFLLTQEPIPYVAAVEMAKKAAAEAKQEHATKWHSVKEDGTPEDVLQLGYHGEVWLVRFNSGGQPMVELGTFTFEKFGDIERMGDREGLHGEVYDDVEFWAEVRTPEFTV